MRCFIIADIDNIELLLCHRRHTVMPPPELLRWPNKVFPDGLDDMHMWAKQQAVQGTNEADISAFGFTSALSVLRMNFLQSSVIVKDCPFLQCQDVPIWSDKLFTDPLYLSFADNMKTVIEQHKAVYAQSPESLGLKLHQLISYIKESRAVGGHQSMQCSKAPDE